MERSAAAAPPQFTAANTPSARVAEIHLSKFGPNGRPTAEVFVAEGTPLKAITNVQQAIYRDLLTRVGLKACEGCRSGLDILIRERFQDVLRVNVESGQFEAGPR